MPLPEESNVPVKAKVVLVDPLTMTALWMNESARQELSETDALDVIGLPVAEAVPLGEVLGVPDALARVAETGEPQHLRANLVSTSQGSVAIVASAYRLPDGALLLVIENAWEPKHRTGGPEGAARPQQRRR